MENLRDLYEQLMNNYSFGRIENLFSIGTDIVCQCKENPFPEDTTAHEIFFQAMRNYHLWTSGGINNRVSGRRLAKNIEALAALKEANPFPETVQVKVEEPVHVLGVVPETPVQETAPSVEPVHQEKGPKETQIMEDKKAFFSRHKRR